jgi:hypothetical protein
LRRTWSCLLQKRWLFLYPLVLAISNTLAFFLVYAAQGEQLTWSAFFEASFDRAQFLHDHFVTGFSLSSRLWVPVATGVGLCLIWALVQAPFFRAIVGNRYPIAPRGWLEVPRLFVFYVIWSLAAFLLPLAVPAQTLLAQIISVALLMIVILVVFSDYVIVFEDAGPIHAVLRSFRLVRLRILPVVILVLAVQLLYGLIAWLYGFYYESGRGVFFLLPVSQLLVDVLVSLFAETLLVFLYEDLRRQSPARAGT